MKAMISQPMNGLTGDEILETRAKAIKWLNDNDYDFVDTYLIVLQHPPYIIRSTNKSDYNTIYRSPCVLDYRSSLEQMSKCDAVYFCKGWEKYRGCRIEHEAAEAYGLKIIEEV